MERAVAVKKLTAILGKKLSYRVNLEAPTSDERPTIKAQWNAAIAERDKIKAQRDARYKAILAANQEYQALHAACKAATEEAGKLSSRLHSHRFTVGTVDDIGVFNVFHLKAEGDSWEEVIAKLTEKKVAA